MNFIGEHSNLLVELKCKWLVLGKQIRAWSVAWVCSLLAKAHCLGELCCLLLKQGALLAQFSLCAVGLNACITYSSGQASLVTSLIPTWDLMGFEILRYWPHESNIPKRMWERVCKHWFTICVEIKFTKKNKRVKLINFSIIKINYIT